MADSALGHTDGTDKQIQANSSLVGGVTKVREHVIIGAHSDPTYTLVLSSISIATSAAHVAIIEADGTNYLRIHRIRVEQVVGATSATLAEFRVYRTTTASTGVTALSAYAFDDSSDTSPYAGVTGSLPSGKGTEGALLLKKRIQMLTTAQVAATTTNPNYWEWKATERAKDIIVQAPTTNGIVLKIVTGIATATVDVEIEFKNTNYL